MTALIDKLWANSKAVVVVCYVLLAVVAVSALFVDTHHAHTWVEQHVPFFWSIFGFVATAAIIGFTRWFGRSGIQARPDFYTCPDSTTCEED